MMLYDGLGWDGATWNGMGWRWIEQDVTVTIIHMGRDRARCNW